MNVYVYIIMGLEHLSISDIYALFVKSGKTNHFCFLLDKDDLMTPSPQVSKI